MTIVIGILVFSLLVLVHEFGHFLLAKRAGIGVTEFAIGMGPRLVSWGKGETVYCIKLIPFGGSCMMLGEDEDSACENAFSKKSVWARISVVAAGPVFNMIFGFVIAILITALGGINPPVVYRVTPGGAAQQAGLQTGDVITSLGGKRISLGRDLDIWSFNHTLSDEPLSVTWERGGESMSGQLYTRVEGWRMGIQYYANEEPAALSLVSGDGAAGRAGLQAGDVLTSVNGVPTPTGSALSAYFDEHPADGSPLTVAYRRGDAALTATVVPEPYRTYDTGFAAAYYYEDSANPLDWLVYGAREMRFWFSYTLMSLRMLVSGQVGLRDMAGPVAIVDTIGTAVESGVEAGGFLPALLNVLSLVILLNVNLGVMNLLPIPALDGGRLIFLLIEAVRGKPIPPDKEGMVHTAGFVLLMVLMAFIFFNDIWRLIG